MHYSCSLSPEQNFQEEIHEKFNDFCYAAASKSQSSHLSHPTHGRTSNMDGYKLVKNPNEDDGIVIMSKSKSWSLL